MLEGETAYHWILSFFAQPGRDRLNQTLLKADVRMGRWLLGQATLMLILGVYSTVVFTLLHVRYSYALGVVMGVTNIIPVIGAMVSLALVIIAAAMAQNRRNLLHLHISRKQVNVARLLGSGLARKHLDQRRFPLH